MPRVAHTLGRDPETPRGPAHDRPRDAKESVIIAAARRTFLALGFDGASMDAIALDAEVSKRTVYSRFRSKDELFIAAIDETCRSILPVEIGDIEASLPPREFVERLAKQVLRGLLSEEALALRRIATFEAGRKPALGRAYFEHGPMVLVAACAPILERLSMREGVAIGDPTRAIWRLGALVTEPLYTMVLFGVAPSDLDAAIDRQIGDGLDAFWRIYDPDAH